MRRTATSAKLDKSQLGAVRVPRSRNHKGFVFGTWDGGRHPASRSTWATWLWYFDSFADRWENSEVLGAANRWIIDCNWKFPSEQFATDVYHAETTHVSAIMAQGKDWVDEESRGLQFSSPGGHGTGFFLDERPT